MSGTRTVYAIKHNVTGNVYVGSTSHSVQYRIQKHMSMLRRRKHNALMQKDFNDYGADYSVFILSGEKELMKAENAEAFWMMYFRSDEQYNKFDKIGKRKSIDDFPHDKGSETLIKNMFGNKRNDFNKAEPEESYVTYRKYADKIGASDSTVAKETGIAAATISAWKHGMYIPKTQKLRKIADFLGVKIDELICQE